MVSVGYRWKLQDLDDNLTLSFPIKNYEQQCSRQQPFHQPGFQNENYQRLTDETPHQHTLLFSSLKIQGCLVRRDGCVILLSLLGYNSFTPLCQFLLFNKANQRYVYRSPLSLRLLLNVTVIIQNRNIYTGEISTDLKEKEVMSKENLNALVNQPGGKKDLRVDDFIDELFHTFKEQLIPILRI